MVFERKRIFLLKKHFQFYVLEEEKAGSTWRRKLELVKMMSETVFFGTRVLSR